MAGKLTLAQATLSNFLLSLVKQLTSGQRLPAGIRRMVLAMRLGEGLQVPHDVLGTPCTGIVQGATTKRGCFS